MEIIEFIHGRLNHYLVTHPTISNFEWKPSQTFGSTPSFLLLTIITYLSTTFLLLKLRLPQPPPSLLRPLTLLHNLLILLLSAAMALGCSLSSLSTLPSPTHLLCFPETTPSPPRRGPLFFWAYVFYLSKLLEFADTFLILLSGSLRRLSFLHVYHHATVVVMCYIWLQTSQSLFPIALVTNAAVHTVMYSYYLACAAGFRPRWKRAVTDLQIAQFLFSFLVSFGMLYLHFVGNGCAGFYGWCFNAVFNVSLFYLFVDFHRKNYKNKRAGHGPDDKDKGL